MTTPTVQSEGRSAPTVAEQILLSMERTRTLLQRGYTQAQSGEDEPNPVSEMMSPLQRIANRFELSAFEMDVLVLCAAVELDLNLPSVLETSPYTQGLRHPT